MPHERITVHRKEVSPELLEQRRLNDESWAEAEAEAEMLEELQRLAHRRELGSQG